MKNSLTTMLTKLKGKTQNQTFALLNNIESTLFFGLFFFLQWKITRIRNVE